MIGIQPGMNLHKQVRKFDALIASAPSVDAAAFLAHLKGRMFATVALGVPQPASNFIPQYHEEWGI